MSFLKKINQARRTLMQQITRNIGKSNAIQRKDQKPEIKRVLICRPNHRLGNLLLITPLFQEIATTFPQAKIDLFVKGGLGPVVFQHYPNIGKIISLPKKPFKEIFNYMKVWVLIKKNHYNIVINVDSNSSSGRIATQMAQSDYKFFGIEDQEIPRAPDDKHIAKRPVYNFRNNLALLGFPTSENDIPTLSMALQDQEMAQAKIALDKLTDQQKQTIAIFTFATGAKCYSESWWESLYEKIKTAFPDCNLVEVLPVENVSQIGFKTPSFYSKNVREICAFIANTDIFVGADSGIMHLASASQTPTIGLFSVTNPEKYEPYGNHGIAINTNETGHDGIVEAIRKILNQGPQYPKL